GWNTAHSIQNMLQALGRQPHKGAAATLISIASLFIGSLGVLAELKDALNRIWRAKEPGGLLTFLRRNVKFLGVIMAIGFLLLVSVGKYILGVYLGRLAVGSYYGAAGSILILLSWVYYSGLIFYFGAEVSKVYASHYGSREHNSAPARLTP